MSRLSLFGGVAALLVVVALGQSYEPVPRASTTDSEGEARGGQPPASPCVQYSFIHWVLSGRTDSPAACTSSCTKAACRGPACCADGPCVQVCPASCNPACCFVPAITQAAPAVKHRKKPSIDGLLEKLEALKARREAIEREEREAHAVLAALLKSQQERISRLAPPAPVVTPLPMTPPAPTPTPATTTHAPLGYFEPVTSYQTTLTKDEKSGQVHRSVHPVTTYIYRQTEGPSAAPPSIRVQPAVTPSGR